MRRTHYSRPCAALSSGAVAVVHYDVMLFYAERDTPVTAIRTENGREFCGAERHPYLHLKLNDTDNRAQGMKVSDTCQVKRVTYCGAITWRYMATASFAPHCGHWTPFSSLRTL
jgi:hypothetical protein